MGGKDGSPGSGHFTPLRIAVGLIAAASLPASMFLMIDYGEKHHLAELVVAALFVPLLVAVAVLEALMWFVDRIEGDRRTLERLRAASRAAGEIGE
jgi:hypothetical protein